MWYITIHLSVGLCTYVRVYVCTYSTNDLSVLTSLVLFEGLSQALIINYVCSVSPLPVMKVTRHAGVDSRVILLRCLIVQRESSSY